MIAVSGVTRKAWIWKLLLFMLFIFSCYKLLYAAYDGYRLTRLEQAWNGFGSTEKGFYDFTVVTGLFDIGRGGWWTQTRSYNEYLGYLMHILKLDVNLVVFIEPKGQGFVERIRKGRESRTLVIPTRIEDLEYFPLLPRIKDIMASPAFKENNSNYNRGLPEATDPLYNLVTNSKISLMHRATSADRFHTDYFVWLDGGYGHGNASLYPADGVWHPKHLIKHPDQVSFIAFEDLSKKTEADAMTLHKRNEAWIAGGLFAGGKSAMEKFHSLHVQVMDEYMRRGSIDDDQTTFVDCVRRDSRTFRPVRGDWYDLMKPFL